MAPSREITPRRYKGAGKCIFCFRSPPEVRLTDEHVIPFAICGVGEILIEDGSCEECNRFANEKYEAIAIANDLNVARILLELKRRRRGKKSKPLMLPPVALGDITVENKNFDIQLEKEEYPNVLLLVTFEPAGLLVGVDRGSDLSKIRIVFVNLGQKDRTVQGVTCSHPHVQGPFALLIAKIAYCYAVAEVGLDGFNGDEIRDLLRLKREDIYNFVGCMADNMHLSSRHLHSLYFRKRGEYLTVIVHIFASYKIPPYEVVVGRWK
jgi:hypothetical protein